MCGDSVRANFCGQRKGKKPQWSMIPTLTRNTSDVLASNPPPCPPRSANHKSAAAAPPPAELSCSCVRQHDKEQQQRAPRETLASKSMSGTKLLSYRIPTAATTANADPFPTAASPSGPQAPHVPPPLHRHESQRLITVNQFTRDSTTRRPR